MAIDLNLDNYKYDLPEEKIAKYPLKERAKSKMLLFEGKNIEHKRFSDIVEVLSDDTHIVFNDTKVIPARIHFFKSTGAKIEVFLLEPIAPKTVEEAMVADKNCNWQCMIGNAKRWKEGSSQEVDLGDEKVTITRTGITEVAFNWSSGRSFSEIVKMLGKVPLPPYIKREVEKNDESRYQTVYSNNDGAVAAPTAGLHFTEEVIEQLQAKGIKQSYLTLHVSAGTFQPIKELDVQKHEMHNEEVIIEKEVVEKLLKLPNVLSVGTTSLRTLESLYWYGHLLEKDPEAPFFIPKLLPYDDEATLSSEKALQNVLDVMNRKNLSFIRGNTEIFILPGYAFRIVKKLLTNFHMPGSTLVLLIAAFVGENWRVIYKEALDNDYRFLSFGDCCLLSN